MSYMYSIWLSTSYGHRWGHLHHVHMGRTYMYMVFECLNFEMCARCWACTCIAKMIPLYDWVGFAHNYSLIQKYIGGTFAF